MQIKTILHPTDFSEYAKCAKPYVTQFAKKFNAKVILFHAIPQPFPVAIMKDSIRTVMRTEAEADMNKLAAEFRAEGVEVEAVFSDDSAFVAILKAVKEKKADLIVMATHGRGFVEHSLIGSTAERVVHKASCPVLTIRKPGHKFVDPYLV